MKSALVDIVYVLLVAKPRHERSIGPIVILLSSEEVGLLWEHR
jgi:hypothetical protein